MFVENLEMEKNVYHEIGKQEIGFGNLFIN